MLQRGRRARRRRSAPVAAAKPQAPALQRGRRARRRRSSHAASCSCSQKSLQRGRRARRRRSARPLPGTSRTVPASTRPACETPEIIRKDGPAGHPVGGFNEAGVRDAGDPVPVGAEAREPSGLQRGRRARRRRSADDELLEECEGGRFNEAGVRDAGDRSRLSRSLLSSSGFNEAGVRDAGDRGLGPERLLLVGEASTRPACETPEISERPDAIPR